jgi:hypothetical protein
MSDRELLELAASAAGYKIRFSPDDRCFRVEDEWAGEWCPLTDHGDALRLAVKVRIRFELRNGEPDWIRAVAPTAPVCADEPVTGDEMEPTCRAIVRAAAAEALFRARRKEG